MPKSNVFKSVDTEQRDHSEIILEQQKLILGLAQEVNDLQERVSKLEGKKEDK
jgi:hypothetical protein